jgi:hypothetical protein
MVLSLRFYFNIQRHSLVCVREEKKFHFDCDLASFRERCRLKKAALLDSVTCPQEAEEEEDMPLSGALQLVGGGSLCARGPDQHQKTLMLQLGIAREGEVIG